MMRKLNSLIAPVFIFVISSLVLSSCYTQVTPSVSKYSKPVYPPLPDRILQLAPENSDRIQLGVEKEKTLNDIAMRLEWEGFTICHIDEEIEILAAQQRFRNERFTLQVNLIKSGDILEAVIFWSTPRSFPHPMSPRRSNPQRWYKAYRDRIISSNNSKAFAIGAFHLLHIPHHSLTFESGYQLNVGTAGLCK